MKGLARVGVAAVMVIGACNGESAADRDPARRIGHGFVAPDDAEPTGVRFPTDRSGSWRALMDVKANPVDVYNDLVRQAQRQGFEMRPTTEVAACTRVMHDSIAEVPLTDRRVDPKTVLYTRCRSRALLEDTALTVTVTYAETGNRGWGHFAVVSLQTQVGDRGPAPDPTFRRKATLTGVFRFGRPKPEPSQTGRKVGYGALSVPEGARLVGSATADDDGEPVVHDVLAAQRVDEVFAGLVAQLPTALPGFRALTIDPEEFDFAGYRVRSHEGIQDAGGPFVRVRALARQDGSGFIVLDGVSG